MSALCGIEGGVELGLLDLIRITERVCDSKFTWGLVILDGVGARMVRRVGGW